MLTAIVNCGPVPAISNATVMTWSPSNTTSYLTTVNYTCNTGTWFSPGIFNMSLTCAANGTWTRDTDASACSGIDLIACLHNSSHLIGCS